jgi:hypothetical protein
VVLRPPRPPRTSLTDPSVQCDRRHTPGRHDTSLLGSAPPPQVVPGKYKPFIRILGKDFASNSGYIQLAFECPSNGKTQYINARFSFEYKKINGRWMITMHHNSAVPDQPDDLIPARKVLADWDFTPIAGVC